MWGDAVERHLRSLVTCLAGARMAVSSTKGRLPFRRRGTANPLAPNWRSHASTLRCHSGPPCHASLFCSSVAVDGALAVQQPQRTHRITP
jgi:hypothetical protein